MVVLLFAPVVVYMCGRSAVCWLVLLVSMGLCACVLVCRVVCLRGSCVALLYESPGGNQVDGLPPALNFESRHSSLLILLGPWQSP